ncbi:MAG: choice-of-anchor B family protein [Gemmatimonadota bacterium]|nr:choice-of-anchor B family protein [Gemmatimonadota bacterium]
MTLHRSVLLTALSLAIAAPATAQSSSFGNTVVVDGETLIVGEPNNSFRPGMVYLFGKSNGAWQERARLTAPDAERADGFGATLALSGDALFVAQRGGAVHVFERAGSSWRYASTLADDGREGLDPGCNAYGYCGTDFGISLAASGAWLFIGEPRSVSDVSRLRPRRRGGDENAPPPASGSVFAYERTASGDWIERQRIESPTGTPADAFGAAIAVSGDHLLIGAPEANSPEGDAEEAVVGAGRTFAYRLTAGRWQMASELNATDHPDGAFGASIAIEEGRAVVGAPGTASGIGAAYLFSVDAGSGGWSASGSRIDPPQGQEGDVFGAAVGFDGDDLWVGAPVVRGLETGGAYVFSAGSLEPREDFRFTEEETNTEDSFGHRVVASGGIAAVTASGLDHQAGGVFVYERQAEGQWRESGRLVSAPDALGAVLGEERRCTDGAVELFDCNDIELYAYVPISLLRAPGKARGIRANDNWGWTDPATGKEYALVGRNDGTSFVDITDPANPVLVGDLPKTPNTPRSQLWRDIKTYENHAFIVADGAGAHGMQVFDLTRLRDVTDPPVLFEPDVLYRGDGLNVVESSHNVIINEETGFAYLTSRGCAGMHMVDISEPTSPTFVGCSEPGSTHDAQCVIYDGPDESYQGREICLRMAGNTFQISDVTDKSAPVQLSTASHPNPAYMHQGWVTEDHAYFIMDDESDVIAGNVGTTRTLIWDLSDLEDPVLAKEFMGSMPASAHNLYVKGDFTYQANYRYGLHILDTSDPLNPREVGYFDTSPYQTGPGFAGAWSTYPFFDSGSIIVTSMQEGLFVLKKRSRPIS